MKYRVVKLLQFLSVCLIIIIFVASNVVIGLVGLKKIEDHARLTAGYALQTVLQATQEALNIWATQRKRDVIAMSSIPDVKLLSEKAALIDQSVKINKCRELQNKLQEILSPLTHQGGYLGFYNYIA